MEKQSQKHVISLNLIRIVPICILQKLLVLSVKCKIQISFENKKYQIETMSVSNNWQTGCCIWCKNICTLTLF
jgi:hypothetical protein